MKHLTRLVFAGLALALSTSGLAETFLATQVLEGEVRYRAFENRTAVVATAPVTALELSFDDRDLRRTTLTIEVDPQRFRSGNIIRDSDIPNRVFEVDMFPRIRFETTRVQAEGFDLPDGATRDLTVVGTLTMHGVERVISVPVEVRREGARITASGSFEVLLSDYEMIRPRFLFVVVEDRVEAEFRVVVDVSSD